MQGFFPKDAALSGKSPAAFSGNPCRSIPPAEAHTHFASRRKTSPPAMPPRQDAKPEILLRKGKRKRSNMLSQTKSLHLQNRVSNKKHNVMSEKKLNTYHFNPQQEPTDEMLEQIMKEVAEEARTSNRKANEEHWQRMQQDIANKRIKWSDKMNSIIYGPK